MSIGLAEVGSLAGERIREGRCTTDNSVALEEVLASVRRRSSVERARLIEWIVPDVERELKSARPAPRKSLRGLWCGLDILEEDIGEVRRGMWGGFPREDV